jgi:hypothetical protein
VRDVGFFSVPGGISPGKDRGNDALLDVGHGQGRVSMTTKVRTIPGDAGGIQSRRALDILQLLIPTPLIHVPVTTFSPFSLRRASRAHSF